MCEAGASFSPASSHLSPPSWCQPPVPRMRGRTFFPSICSPHSRIWPSNSLATQRVPPCNLPRCKCKPCLHDPGACLWACAIHHSHVFRWTRPLPATLFAHDLFFSLPIHTLSRELRFEQLACPSVTKKKGTPIPAHVTRWCSANSAPRAKASLYKATFTFILRRRHARRQQHVGLDYGTALSPGPGTSPPASPGPSATPSRCACGRIRSWTKDGT